LVIVVGSIFFLIHAHWYLIWGGWRGSKRLPVCVFHFGNYCKNFCEIR